MNKIINDASETVGELLAKRKSLCEAAEKMIDDHYSLSEAERMTTVPISENKEFQQFIIEINDYDKKLETHGVWVSIGNNTFRTEKDPKGLK